MSVPDQLPLDIPMPSVGEVLASAQRSVASAVASGDLGPERDALLIAHLYALAASMDRLAGRIEPRALALLSRELRACAEALGLSRDRPSAPDPVAGPFDFLTAT
jgi:hypothetical protein